MKQTPKAAKPAFNPLSKLNAPQLPKLKLNAPQLPKLNLERLNLEAVLQRFKPAAKTTEKAIKVSAAKRGGKHSTGLPTPPLHRAKKALNGLKSLALERLKTGLKSGQQHRNPNATHEAPRTGSITRKANITLARIYLGTIVLALPIIYYSASLEAESQALSKLSLLSNTLSSVRSYIKESVTPHFIEKGEYFGKAMSPVVVTKGVAALFKKTDPDKIIRIISDNPLNFEDTPQGEEYNVLGKLRLSDQKQSQGRISYNNKAFVYKATVESVTKSCLACHGEKATAPAAQLARFSQGGYNWEVGQKIGASIYAVPVSDTTTIAVTRSAQILGLISLLFGAMFVFFNSFLYRSVLEPIIQLSGSINRIAAGEPEALNAELLSNQDDEIGQMIDGTDKMRRSLNAFLNQGDQ